MHKWQTFLDNSKKKKKETWDYQRNGDSTSYHKKILIIDLNNILNNTLCLCDFGWGDRGVWNGDIDRIAGDKGWNSGTKWMEINTFYLHKFIYLK